jgi:GTP cyclohydrolase I
LNIGENPTRQGLRKTPERAAKALLHFIKGYEEKICCKKNSSDLFIFYTDKTYRYSQRCYIRRRH